MVKRVIGLTSVLETASVVAGSEVCIVDVELSQADNVVTGNENVGSLIIPIPRPIVIVVIKPGTVMVVVMQSSLSSKVKTSVMSSRWIRDP